MSHCHLNSHISISRTALSLSQRRFSEWQLIQRFKTSDEIRQLWVLRTKGNIHITHTPPSQGSENVMEEDIIHPHHSKTQAMSWKSISHIPTIPRLRECHGRVGRKSVRAWGWQQVSWHAVFWLWHYCCPHKLIEAVATCTRAAKDCAYHNSILCGRVA